MNRWKTVLGFGLWLCLSSASLAYAQEDLSPPTDVVLAFKEVRPGEETQCSGGSILAAVDCVAIRIEGAGEDGMIHSLAELGLTLTPVLRPRDNFAVVNVFVRVDGGDPNLTGNFENPAQIEADAASDTHLVKERLKRWRTQLDQTKIDELLETGQTEVPISRPFEGLKILGLENPPAMLTLIMPVRVAKRAEGAKEDQAY